jgi:AcrR family transcriptional regulator
VAARLGVQPPSLYNHVAGLPGLYRELALLNARRLADRLAQVAIGKSGSQALIALAEAYRTYIKEYSGLYMATLQASRNQGPADAELQEMENRIVGIVLAVLASFGLADEAAVHAARGIRSLVHGFATLEIAGGFGLPLDCDESFRRLLDIFISGLDKPTLQSG